MTSGVYPRTKEHGRRISEAVKGHPVSKETRKKISEANKGKNNWMYGKHHTREWKGRMRKIMTGRVLSEEWKKKISKARKGIKFSSEHKKNLSKSLKGSRPKEYYQRIGLIGVQKQQNSKEPTSIETKVYKELKARHVLFEPQKLINGKFLVDAYVPKFNLVIEADGDYWHSLPRVMKKDKAENAYLKKCGYNLLRLSEKEINNGSFKERMVT